MSAPAMKPFDLPERITSPFGGTAADKVLVEESALSKVSQAMPSMARSVFQWRNACMRCFASGALDQHRAAQTAADANRGNPALGSRPLEHVEQMQDDPRAGRADR